MTTLRFIQTGLVFLLLAIYPTHSVLALDKAQLETSLSKALHEKNLPGLRAAVIQGGDTAIVAAVGFADPENEMPLDSEIGMPGGSTGKTFAAALTLTLVEEGVLTLDDPIRSWVGDTDWFTKLKNGDEITVRHLLAHASGLSDYPGSLRFQSAMIWRVLRKGSAYFTPEELIGYAANRDSEFLPGRGFRYTDAGYLVLGRVIEAAAQQSYYDLLVEKILIPHGLSNIRPAVDSALPNIAVGHQGGTAVLKDDGRMKFDPRSEWTGGGLVITPKALARFYQLLSAGEIVSSRSFNQMINGVWRDSEKEWHYGFGLFVNPTQGYVEHGGLWPGYRTHARHYLEGNLTIVVQTNRDGNVDLPSLVSAIALAI